MQAGNPEPSDEPSDERTQSSFAELDALARRAAGEHNVLSTSRHNRNPLQFRSAHAVLIIPPRSTPQTLLHPPRIACASLTRAHQHLLPTRSSIAAQYFTTPASWQRLIRGRTLPCSFTISQPLSAVRARTASSIQSSLQDVLEALSAHDLGCEPTDADTQLLQLILISDTCSPPHALQLLIPKTRVKNALLRARSALSEF